MEEREKGRNEDGRKGKKEARALKIKMISEMGRREIRKMEKQNERREIN